MARTTKTDDLTLLTVEEVAQHLGISKRTVWSLIASKDIPTVRVGPRSVRVTTTDLAAFIDSRRARE